MSDDKGKSNFSMLDLFRTEVSEQGKVLTEGLLALEQNPVAADQLEAVMRAAHSVKGAARLVGVEPVVQLAHVVEDVFVAAQQAALILKPDGIDVLLNVVDTISSISMLDETEIAAWGNQHKNKLDELIQSVRAIRLGERVVKNTATQKEVSAPVAPVQPRNDSAAMNAPASGAQLADSSMLDLFRIEASEQSKSLTEGLLALEGKSEVAERLESLMRAAHSIKGAARMVGVQPIVRLAHVMEDVFVAAQKSKIVLSANDIDVLLQSTDAIASFVDLSDIGIANWLEVHGDELEDMLNKLAAIKSQELLDIPDTAIEDTAVAEKTQTIPVLQLPTRQVQHVQAQKNKAASATGAGEDKDRVLRVTAERWNHLMGLAGEVKVEAGWLQPYVVSMSKLKRRQIELVEILDALRCSLDDMRAPKPVIEMLLQGQKKISECRRLLADQTADLDGYDRRINNLSERLHRETIRTRMRPFSDGVQGFQRMVRDIAKSLGKKVKLEIVGLSIQVDRDVLEKMEAPLNHILRNALDHGVDVPAERIKAGKPEQATIRVAAAHSDGMLSIMIDDDGRGIDIEHLRKKVIEKKLVTGEMAAKLSEKELLEFLFLPSFSTKEEVTDISGRGVGLDVVLDTVQKMRGSVETTTRLGVGTRFHMRLPLTMSVISSLIAEISGEPYAFPLARIIRAVKLPSQDIDVLEDHQFAKIDGENIGLVGAAQVLGLGTQLVSGGELSVIIIGDRHNRCGIVVDKLLGQKELAIQALDPRLGKVQDVSAAAVLEDGSPVLILDVDDLVLSVDALIRKGSIAKVTTASHAEISATVRHILVVDDSLTVREVERNLLENAGYHVDVAVDGVDGWNAIRTFKEYDLIVTDIDMPRMDGIELVRLIKSDRDYNSVPVIIVSYKEREEDRRRGMEAGADYYLTKGSFHDNSLLDAVSDLIGEVEA
jgi:two-component system sensor histidine kinase and response regulator WspE